jgi:hypothetical protein
MFQNDELNFHLRTSPTVKSNAKIIAEWNLNSYENISYVGNYRYRPLEGPTAKFGQLPSFFDASDAGNFFTGATDSDVVLDGGIDDGGVPTLLQQPKQKEKLLYSLEDCFGRFRPRSGINKVRYGVTQFLHYPNSDMVSRPRYYMSHKDDKFKYWTSYRVENGVEYGIANASPLGTNHINDAAPFVVYKSPVAANRIVLKMQTNVGDINKTPFFTLNGRINDPFFGDENKTTPSEWQVDVLVDGTWQKAFGASPLDKRSDGSAIIGSDGYVELYFGLIVPKQFSSRFVFKSELSSVDALPDSGVDGDAYLVRPSDTDRGSFYVRQNSGYTSFVPEYGWQLFTEGSDDGLVTNLGNPDKYVIPNYPVQYREVQYLSGIRFGVKRMNKFSSTLDLIEMSPRLAADITDMVSEYSVSKVASDLGSTGLPVGQLLASTGSLTIFDAEQAFNSSNQNSILAQHSLKNMQVKFYENITTEDKFTRITKNYLVPIKTLYADTFPVINAQSRDVAVDLRDLYLYFESIPAPDLLLTNVSLSSAVSILLDYVGFSNYKFNRLSNESEDIIPFFYCQSEKSIAEVLQDLAVSTQSAMFFDEYNNLVVASRNYFIPSAEERGTDIQLLGKEVALFSEDDFTEDFGADLVRLYDLPNIVSVSSQDDAIFNDGKISYKSHYIQKSQATTAQTYMLDSEKNWVYKPVLLWEASGEEIAKAQNQQTATQNAYSLTAIPLKSDLSDVVPYVSGGQVLSNIIDLGEAVYWLGRYNGYFYANGEVIKFDAIEYSIPGVVDVVWITSVDEYQNYFSKIPFKGKMYPTGRVRIYSEPKYKTLAGNTVLQDGAVEKHGRGQFGTKVAYHSAGINPAWTDGSRIKGVGMNAKFIFDPVGTSEVKSVEALPTDKKALYNSILVAKSDIKQLNETVNQLNVSLLSDPTNATVLASIASTKQQIANKEAQAKADIKTLSDYLNISGKFLNISAATSQSKRTEVTGKIRNFMSYSYGSENNTTANLATDTQMVQASALVVNGAASDRAEYSSINHLTYVHTPVARSSATTPVSETKHTHFGTRMRIVGKNAISSDSSQEAHGSMTYLTVETDTPEDKPNITGGSGGLAGLMNVSTGEGYYYEIAALDADNVDKYGAANVFFYKVVAGGTDETSFAIPQLLWRGMSSITVDTGNFVGQSRIFAQEEQTVYDIAFEYVDNVDGTRTFFLYMNGTQIGTVVDTSPISAGNGSALFVRGTSKCMFENIYSMSNNYAENPSTKIDPVVASAFGVENVTMNDSFSKYAISGLVQSTYLSSIGPSGVPKYNIYYDEFGTIMREADYLNIRYDKAFPALYSRIAPNTNKTKTYVVSSYYGSPYGAEFLIFNATDTVITLDSSSAGSLQIQGISFTQQSNNDLTVDEFYSKKSDFSNPTVENGIVVSSPTSVKQTYQDIKNTRSTYGRNGFTIDAPYVQSRDMATSIMKWLSERIMKKRKSVGLEIFAMPTLQLGDIVQVQYEADGVNQIPGSSRFVVYQIDYSKNVSDTNMSVYLSEVD